jgi:ABC-type glycerol-3-phosphate transport system substrate-binding protein
MYGLPHEMNPGAYACCYFNKDLVEDAGLTPPNDDWTVEDFPELASKVQDRDNKIYGTAWIPGRFYAMSSVARTFGGRLITLDGKKWTFATDPACVEAARWIYDIRNKWDAGTKREEAEGLSFNAGRVGFHISNIQSSGSVITGVGDKFNLEIILAPQSKAGLHGYYAFVNNMCVYAKSKVGQTAYDCIKYMTSPEVAMSAFVEQTHPTGRKSVWAAAEEKGAHPIWKRVGDWMAAEKAPGDMPMPYNLRFEEVVDKWSNVHHKLWYGEVGFQEGVDLIQRECQTIVDLPRE